MKEEPDSLVSFLLLLSSNNIRLSFSLRSEIKIKKYVTKERRIMKKIKIKRILSSLCKPLLLILFFFNLRNHLTFPYHSTKEAAVTRFLHHPTSPVVGRRPPPSGWYGSDTSDERREETSGETDQTRGRIGSGKDMDFTDNRLLQRIIDH